MNIELTKEQYETLLTTSGIGSAVLGILGDMIEDGADYKKRGQEADALETHLLGYAAAFGVDVQTEIFEGETVYTDEEYTSRIQSVLSEYEEFVMFDSLANRLAWRDFRSEHNREQLRKMTKKNHGYFGVELYPYEEKYWKEFDDAGVDRLVIDGAMPVLLEDGDEDE